MTLLTICQGAARAARVVPPTYIVGNPDETAQLLLQLANDEGEALARRRPGGWVAMTNQYTFTTTAITTTGDVANGSFTVANIPSTAGVSADTWQVFGDGIPNNAIVSSLTPTSVTWSGAPASSATGTGVQITLGQSDYALPPDYERPIDGTFWDRGRFWQMRGALSPQQWQLYKSSVLGYSATIQRRYRIRNVSGTVYLSIDPVPTDNGDTLVWEYVSNAWCQSAAAVRQTQWLADSDTGVVDEFLIRKGVIYRLLERLGMSYGEAQDEYERQCDKAVAHDGGTQVISMVRSDLPHLISPWNVPDSGFGQ